MTTSENEKAETLNSFFSSVFTPLSKGPTPQLEARSVNTILADIEFTEEGVRKKLSKLKISKSPGPDGHHPRVYQELAEVISSPLYSLA